MEMRTGLGRLQNVMQHAVAVSTMYLVRCVLIFAFYAGNNFCGLDPVTGPVACEAYIPSYFYNATSRKCEKFIYGGCGGTRNRFSTLDECQATCSQ